MNFFNRRRADLSSLSVVLGLVLALAPTASAQSVSPAERAAQQLERDGENLRSTEDAAELADEAARAALDAAREAKAAAAAAQAAADRAKAAADLARRARAAAQRSTRPAPARSSVEGRPILSPRGSAPPSAAVPVPRQRAERSGSARPAPARGRVIRVGPTDQYRAPSEAANIARDGDVIEIEAATYVGDVAVWRANDLVIRGIEGRPHMKAGGRAAERKAIWVIKGDNTTVENVELSGARVGDRNGAGIRLEGTGLIIRDSHFHHNEMGLLTSDNDKSDILIERSEFDHNTVDYGRYGRLGHNIYIGSVRSFTLRASYVHHAFTGHNVKTRAQTNRILFNRLMDERDGSSSYVIDLPNGGKAYLVGNLIQQGRQAENWAVINFRSKRGYGGDQVYMLHNTIVSDREQGIVIQNGSDRPAIMVNNIIVGRLRPSEGSSRLVSNLIVGGDGEGLLGRIAGDARRLLRGDTHRTGGDNITAQDAMLVDRDGFDYRLRPGSPAIDAGADPAIAWDAATLPELEYQHPLRTETRPAIGKPDIGAYEFNPR